jgi:beta-lactamase regulating signal transducer with metallopeptidase domain
MSERLLNLLLQQALLLSAGIALVAPLRPLLLRHLGAGGVYATWLLVPLLLAAAWLPRPAQEPLLVALQAAGTTMTATTPALPVLPAGQAPAWLTLWLAGAALVATTQAVRQARLARQGPLLPAGSSPALVGLLWPQVALPIDFEQRFNAAERELILAHEQVHRDRRDNFWNLLACLLAALHWWNPLAWWAARRMRADQELACDAAVLATRPGATADYTRALLAAHDLTQHGAPMASRWGTTHPLVERISMLNHARRLSGLGRMAIGALLLVAAGLGYALQAAEPPKDGRRAALKLDISYRTDKDGERQTLSSQPTLRVRLGERATLMFNGTPDKPTPQTLSIALVARDAGNDRVELQMEVGKGSPLTVVSRPRLITGNGVKALIEQGRDDRGTSEHLSIAVTPTLLGDDEAGTQSGTR